MWGAPLLHHRRVEQRPFKGRSEYDDVYHAHDLLQLEKESMQQREELKQRSRNSNRHPRPKFEGEARSRQDFQPPPREALLGAFQPARYRGPSTPLSRPPLESRTSYKDDYPWKQPPPASEYASLGEAAPQAQRQRARFEGESSYKRDYYRRELPAQGPSVGPMVWRGSGAKFEGTTHSAEAFKPYSQDDYCQALEQAPPPSPSRQRHRFEGVARSQEDFQAPPREAYAALEDPATQQRPRRSPVAFHAETEYARSYPIYPPGVSNASDIPKEASQRQRAEDRDFATTAASAFVAPPEKPPCPAAVAIHEKAPPPMPSGREHVYFDPQVRNWF